MQELELKYGCNPNQSPARIYMSSGALPVAVLNGKPGYINFLDALNAWQLVCELKKATGLPSAASFKHVSPAGAAVGLPLSDTLRAACFLDASLELSPIACAYARARGADRLSSFGDWAALSEPCDEPTARLLLHEVSDGVISPGYTAAALELLKTKRKGGYNIVQIDAGYLPAAIETKEVFGIRFEQGRNDLNIDASMLQNRPTLNKTLSPEQIRDLLVALVTLKYTQSNSVCFAKDGQAIGVGAGQQSRIHCTRLAATKADLWHLRQQPRVLALPFVAGLSRPERDNAIDVFLSEDADRLQANPAWQRLFSQTPVPFTREEKAKIISAVRGVALGSDAFFPFSDNIDRAHQSGVDCIAQPGGSLRDDAVIAACDDYDIAMAFTGVRLFHH